MPSVLVNEDLKVIDSQTVPNSQFDDFVDNNDNVVPDASNHGSESSDVEILEPTSILDKLMKEDDNNSEDNEIDSKLQGMGNLKLT